MKATVSAHESRVKATAREAFTALLGPEWAEQRSREIEALPLVAWKGKLLRTVTCDGPFGRGPHNLNVPESVLWALIDPKSYRCAFHR